MMKENWADMNADNTKFPEGYSRLLPYLTVKDMESALDFYQSAFALEKFNVNEHEGNIVHAELKCGDAVIFMLKPEGLHSKTVFAPNTSKQQPPIDLMLYVDNVDDIFKKTLAQNSIQISAPNNVPWGERVAVIRDPEGYVWVLAQHLHDTV